MTPGKRPVPVDKGNRLAAGPLYVRPFVMEDAEMLHAALGDFEVMRFIEPPYTMDQTRAFIERAGLCQPPRVYAACLCETGEVIGHMIFHPWDETAWEIGWVLRRECWGRGYATALTRALISEATRRDIPALVIECAPGNAASRRIAIKCGFRFRGEADGLCIYKLLLSGGTP